MSTLEARVDKSAPDTILQDQRLANYEANPMQEGAFSPMSNAMAGASISSGNVHLMISIGNGPRGYLYL